MAPSHLKAQAFKEMKWLLEFLPNLSKITLKSVSDKTQNLQEK